ncbi:MAG: hypothetical protein M0026_07075 [Nocardiopsaceae bacterium]|nr:hypothetical protein [Nocardiopsaceae bacterium]
MKRMAAVLVTPRTGAVPPPGTDPAAFALALTEDTYEVVASLELCEPAVAVWAAGQSEADAMAARAAEVTWPGTPVLRLAGGAPLAGALAKLRRLGADQAAVVAADAPDLPPLLVGKLFRGLGNAEIAVCPAENGGLAGFASRLPLPPWAGNPDLDDSGALAALTTARPERRALSVVPGWHRLRAPGDISRLDPGLEGWEATRALLSPRY